MIINQQPPSGGGGGGATHTVTCSYAAYGIPKVYDKSTNSWLEQTNACAGEIVLIRFLYSNDSSDIKPFPNIFVDGGQQYFNASIDGGYSTVAKLVSGKAKLYYKGEYRAFIMPDSDVVVTSEEGEPE